MAAALLSIFAETSQLVMLYRTPSLTDVATSVLGAILGVIVVARYNLEPPNSRPPGGPEQLPLCLPCC
jgi:VanZ family protein